MLDLWHKSLMFTIARPHSTNATTLPYYYYYYYISYYLGMTVF